MRSCKSGILLIEILVYLSLFSFILIGLVTILRTESQVDSAMRRLDGIHDARQTSWKLSRWLSFGTHVLFPAISNDATQWSNKLLFADQNHENRLIYLDSDHNLKMCTGNGVIELLAENVIEFGVKHIDEMLLIYRMKIIEPKGKKVFIMSNTAHLANNDLKELCSKE